jgi:putative aldouronate transport system substrate-binding protein
MKLSFKKSLIFLVLSLLLVVSACSSNTSVETTNNEPGDSNSTTQESTTEGGEETLDPITFSLFFGEPNDNWNHMQDTVGKVITEKTGVTLEGEFTVGGVSERISLMTASEVYPDLIMPSGDTGLLVEAEALLDLTPLIEEHAPNIKRILGDNMKRLRYSDDDHSIYFVPNLAGVDHVNFDYTGGFQLQHAVVKELGYPEIRTVKDFENAIREYKDKYPTIDGQPTIGLSLLADDWRMLISVTNPAFTATGATDDGEYYIDPETHEAIYHYRRPEEKEYFRWLNHMNHTGLLDPESFVQKYDQYTAKVASGRILGLIDATWNIGTAVNALKSEGKYERTYGSYPVTMSKEIKNASTQSTGFLGGWGIGITKSNPDPVRAIKFLDFLASDEGQILINWGVEGVHYVYEDGKRVFLPEVQDRRINDADNFSREEGLNQYNISVRYGDGVKDSTGSYYTPNFPETVLEGYSDIEKEVLEAYGGTYWKDLFPPMEEFPVKPWGAAWMISIPNDSELVILQQRMKDIMTRRVPEAILAHPDKFDAVWDSFLAEIESAGVERMEQQYTELVKQRVALWND